jgi:N-acetylmuramoyl-L-alanine amidase
MIRHLSPNFGTRRDGLRPTLIVLHYTEMSDAEAALARLCAPEAQVSSHYLIGSDGRLWQLVDEAARAWHAGAGAWRGQGDVNSRSVGIEIDNDGRSPFTEPQMRALETLLPAIMTRWRIAPAGVIAHSDLAPERKTDPGPRFDWRRLAMQGLAIWPWTLGNADAPLAESLDRIGYPRVPAEMRLAAFRLRFRPGATGPEAAEDRALADAVAAAF